MAENPSERLPEDDDPLVEDTDFSPSEKYRRGRIVTDTDVGAAASP